MNRLIGEFFEFYKKEEELDVKEAKIKRQIEDTVNKVKQTNPMAGSITNTVTINLVANTQIAVGGSAAMVYLPDEGETLAKAGEAFYINVGTLFPIYEETLPRTAKVLHEDSKNWVLDPVAVGIGSLRTKLLQQFKEYKPSVIRGNASEIIALAGLWELEGGGKESTVRGVDSTDATNDAESSAISLAKWTGGAVAISGETDVVTDGNTLVYSYGGSHFLGKITGAGCALGGVSAIYTTQSSPFIAALTATSVFNVAGKRAEKNASGPGSFEKEFIDELYKATAKDIAENSFEIKEVTSE